jgi:general secretion pathway protein D
MMSHRFTFPQARRRLRLLAAAAALAAVLTAGSAQAQEEITLNFTGADISALIETVAQVTGRRFIVDPRVRAQVTVISHNPMASDELYRVFLSILQVHGFSAVESGEVTKIIPDINAKQVGVPIGQPNDPRAGDEIVTQIITVRNVPVAQLVPILRPLVPQQGHLAAYPPTNALIISDRAGNIERMTDIVRRIDRESDDDVEVIRLENASAGEMVRVLGVLQQQQMQEDLGGGRLGMAADERTNSLLISGERNLRLRARALIAHLDTPVAGGGDTRVIYLCYARATDLAAVLTGVSEMLPEAQQQPAGEGAQARRRAGSDINIQPDEATNALVITAPPSVQRSLEAIIRQLDVRRAQILVEAAIAEITESRGRELGVEVGGFDSQGTRPAFGSFFNEHSGHIRSTINPQTGQPTPGLLGSGLSMVMGDTTGRYRFGAFLRALASDANSNILSTPSLVTLDNQEAEIRVARNVPFITGSYTGVGTTDVTNPFTTVQREDVGVILKIKPQINEGNAVMLDIEQEVSNVASTGNLGPETNKRSIKTSILVEDGQMIALGGLIDDAIEEREQKIPLLGDIPVLGQVFRSRSTEKTKRNLMLFLQPTILRDSVSTDHFSQRKYNFIRAEQLGQRERGIQLMPGETRPVLPALDRPMLPSPFE